MIEKRVRDGAIVHIADHLGSLWGSRWRYKEPTLPT